MRILVGVLLVACTGLAAAQPAPPVVGATKVHTLTPATGFVEDAIAIDRDYLAYVTTDGTTRSLLHVASLQPPYPEKVVELTAVTLQPRALRFVGTKVLVIGTPVTSPTAAPGPAMVAALLEIEREKARPVHYTITGGEITLITRDGKPRIAVHDTKQLKNSIRHTVSVFSIDSGRRIGPARTFETDPTGKHGKLDFQVNHWSDGGTRAHGIRGGTWNKKDDQRSPDVEATYDVLTGKIVGTPITDLVEQRRRFQALRDSGGALDFVRLNWDQSGLLIAHGGKLAPLALDQPFSMYLRDSLQAHVTADRAWLALKVDKVHPDAVARKKADLEYLDVFHAGPDNQAVRKARVLVGVARHRFGVAGNRFWLLERNATVARGGKSLVVYQVN